MPPNWPSTVGAPARVSRMRCGASGVMAAGTSTGIDTSVFDGSASKVSIWLPLGTVVGTTRSTLAVPLVTGTVPMSRPPTATCNSVFWGAARLVRSNIGHRELE